jgi:2-dehydro-3-deoxygluconokinase
MKNIFLLGECMIELKAQSVIKSNSKATEPKFLKQSFAGDAFNTAVYLKRTFADLNAYFISAVGADKLSSGMVAFFEQEKIRTEFVFRSKEKNSGLYAIDTDEFGERSFTYWRENSAARNVMSFIDDQVVESISTGDVVFFSGISLAVLIPDDRPKFWQFINKLKELGAVIVFDPNYRARMWDNEAQAKEQFEQAFSNADILLPGVDDFEQLYGLSTAEAVYDFCKPYQFDELVIKNGEAGIVCYSDEQMLHFPIVPIKNVIDTTSAGDSFNGVYLGARAKGFDITDAIGLASKAAGFVIQHHGAIVEQCAYQQFIKEQLI